MILAILAKLIYDQTLNSENPIQTTVEGIKIFTRDELLETKTNLNLLYLAVLGDVYDVSAGSKHYQPGGSYDFFVGNLVDMQLFDKLT